MNKHTLVKRTWKALTSVAASVCLLAAANNASALAFGNPDPVNLNDDIDGSGYFTNGAIGTLAFELFDLADSTSTFGFYEEGAPGTLTPIFEAADLSGESALVDFTNGFVFDNEDAAIQNLFAAPTGSIGFYLATLGTVLYSDPLLNFGGLDLAAAYETVSGDFTNILFYDGQADGPANLLSWHVISDITPARATPAPVPVPASALLVLLGLGALVSRRRA